MSSKTGAISVEPTTQLQDLAVPEKPSLGKGSTPSPEVRRNRKGRGSPGRGASASMVSRGVIGVFLLSALPLLCLELRRGIPDLGVKDLILLCGRIFLLLALLTLIISVTTSWLNSFKSPQVYLKEEEEKNEEKQKLVRKKQQEAQGEKASRYIENVLKPHQEMKLKKLEERFYQMTGETWKLSNGHKLGGDKDLVLENESQTAFKTSNREAAKRRNLPKLLTKVSPSAEQPTRKEVLDLPEEPPETAEEVVTVALRCPSGSVLRRRFFKSCSSQVLFDWMMKIGYHTSQYSLSTSFPRRPLEVGGGWSLQDIGITVDTVLNVEENEQTSNEERRTACSP
ncbi:UBX domain-containing protein 8 isoform X1 [Mustela putorius furo]|uniref:UBX domain-containing protein 8 n=2 Tax=Mustela putorius furo TaxID=9669 RepID=A0A8U0RRJ7_MUSPF|nr:UBX domain-containing protein 8 isoform X1 [Mustela putorius furo]XP_044929721.1 UBX domain-containing protein 8 isoform X1 [Mustela putorius furo]